jgi:hypothetical protein
MLPNNPLIESSTPPAVARTWLGRLSYSRARSGRSRLLPAAWRPCSRGPARRAATVGARHPAKLQASCLPISDNPTPTVVRVGTPRALNGRDLRCLPPPGSGTSAGPHFASRCPPTAGRLPRAAGLLIFRTADRPQCATLCCQLGTISPAWPIALLQEPQRRRDHRHRQDGLRRRQVAPQPGTGRPPG